MKTSQLRVTGSLVVLCTVAFLATNFNPSLAFAQKTVRQCTLKDGTIDRYNKDCATAVKLVDEAMDEAQKAQAKKVAVREEAKDTAETARFERAQKSITRICKADKYDEVSCPVDDWEKMALSVYEMAQVHFKNNRAMLGTLEDDMSGRGAVKALDNDKFVAKWLPRLSGSTNTLVVRRPVFAEASSGTPVRSTSIPKVDCYLAVDRYTSCNAGQVTTNVVFPQECSYLLATYAVGKCVGSK